MLPWLTDYHGRVTVQSLWLLITVPRKPWWAIIAETCRANAVVFLLLHQEHRGLRLPRKRVPCKCHDFCLLYRDCRGFRLLRSVPCKCRDF